MLKYLQSILLLCLLIYHCSGFLDLQANASSSRPDIAAADSLEAQSTARNSEQNGGASGGPVKKCAVCEDEADTVKCFHCNKMVCASCKQSHSGTCFNFINLMSEVLRYLFFVI